MSGVTRRLFRGSSASHSSRGSGYSSASVPSRLFGPGGGQYSKVSKKTGINRKKGYIAKVLTKEELKCRVLQVKGLRPFDGVNGYCWLNYREEVTGKAQYLAPLYIVDLLAKATGNTVVYQMRQNAGNVSWKTVSGQDNTSGSLLSTWNTKHQSLDFPDLVNNSEKLHYGKVNVALNLYGQKNRPVDITVQLVQFEDDQVAPHDDYYVTNSNKEDHDIFWGEQLKTMVANPIAKDNVSFKHKMKVLKSKTVHIDAAGTTDADNDPHVVTLNWKHGVHKTISHIRRRTNEDTAADLANETVVNPDTLWKMNGPLVKDRVYLIIKANVYSMIPTSVADAGINNTYCPSFDYNIHVSQYATHG